MFFHVRETAYHCTPSAPDPILARQLQELIGGQWGEISVMLGYLMQGWNCRGPQKYKDMIMAIGTEEIGHVEMLATCVARLLESSPVETQEHAAKDGIIGAVLGGAKVQDVILAGMNPQHAIVTGGGADASDSNGNPWSARYIVSSGNLYADFRFNVTAESQGRLQATRVYNMTEDQGVRQMLSYLIARDTMHQNQWLAALRELEEDGLDGTPTPANFPRDVEPREFSHAFLNHTEGMAASEGSWAKGPTPDGKGEFTFIDRPPALGPVQQLGQIDPRLYGTPAMPVPPARA